MRIFRSKTRIRRGDGGVSVPESGPIPAPGQREKIRQVLNGGRVQAKLEVSAPEDASEREADQVAERVMRAPDSPGDPSAAPPRIQRKCADCEEEEKKDQGVVHTKAGGAGAQATGAPAAVNAVRSGGHPLPGAERAFFEARFGRSFGQVQLHTDAGAADASRALHAQAFTYKNHIAFATGRYAPGTESGRKLLAHELTHVVQQNSGDATQLRRFPGPPAALPAPVHTPAPASTPKAPLPLPPHKNPATQAKTSAPAFSVSKSNYLALLSVALDQMQGSLVAANTLSGFVEPMLRAMAAHAEWKDAAGKVGGGDFVEYKLPWDPKRKLKLKLILDDQDKPPLAGLFHATGSDAATITLFIRANDDADTMSQTAYHESLHLITWLRGNSSAKKPLGDSMGLNSSQKEVLDNLNIQSQAPKLKVIRRRVERIAETVNATRASDKQIPAAKIDSMAEWLLQEYLVRIESEVYRLFGIQEQVNKLPPGQGMVFKATDPGSFFKASDVEIYLFDQSGVFKPEDKAALTELDLQDIAAIAKIFDDGVEWLVKRRFSSFAFRTEHRPQVEILQMPKRSFVDKIQPAD